MWVEGNYRRNLLDMHIDDWNEVFLTKLDCKQYVDALKAAGMQAAMVKAKPHTGLCHYKDPGIGRMHKGLGGHDYLQEMIELCHAEGIAVVVYFTQIFDNWAYDNHPAWRCIAPDGKTFREYRGTKNFKTGRYGIVCPNNPEYRDYVRQGLQQLNRSYDFEGMFLDMTFFPEICYCAHCREKYFAQTGKEMPRVIDWQSEEFREFQHIRELWIREYALFATQCVKEIKPQVTIEHQCSMVAAPWINASSEYLMDAVDCASGDYYGGFLQQTFINKYYKNVTAALPFVYHTSRCDPELLLHTTTKSAEELLLHVITALVHNGAFLLVDAINPDGTIVPEVYHDLMKTVFAQTKPYEQYVSGNLLSNVAVWFATHAKYDPNETGIQITDKTFDTKYYMEAPVATASILRENNLPFEVVGSRNLKNLKEDVLVLSHVAAMRDDEMADIEAFVQAGGSLYVSGPIGHPRLAELIGVKCIGQTEHDFTYMSPTPEGSDLFEGFSRLAPLTVSMKQYLVETTCDDCTVLATVTLPYTPTHNGQFAAIHSNPPGIHTGHPAAILRRTGKGKIFWAAAPLEMLSPYMSRRVFKNIITSLCKTLKFTSNAPKFVEIIGWRKEEKTYFAAINQQEQPPVAPMYDICIDLPQQGLRARLPESGAELTTEQTENGTRIHLPRLDVFIILEVYG